jgi:hypothetical protein
MKALAELMKEDFTQFPGLPAAQRCKAHSQGDKCRKELGHQAIDAVHEGQFTIWQENKFRQEKFVRTSTRRHRSANRFVRALSQNSHMVPAKERAGFIGHLGRVIKFLRGAA